MWKNIAFISLMIAVGMFLYVRFRVPPKIDFITLETTDLEGEKIDINNYAGKNIFITMWAPWCGDCIKEMPGLQYLSDELNLTILAISGYDIEKEKSFKQKYNYNFTYLHMSETLKEIGIHSIPTNYIINKNGKVVYEKVGAEDWYDSKVVTKVKNLLL